MNISPQPKRCWSASSWCSAVFENDCVQNEYWSSGHVLAYLALERPALSFCGVSCML